MRPVSRMGHIVFGAPGVDRFHLIERLARELRSRGHRATVLCLDAAEFEFWSAQGLAVTRIAPGVPDAGRVPLELLAEADRRRRDPTHARGSLAPVCHRLARFLPGLLRWFETDAPDLVVMHQRRTSSHLLIQFLARECGTRVFWTGQGLLPHTIQIDDEGLDGDARAGRRSAWDFRSLPVDAEFLGAALAAAVGRNAPPALSRRALQVPRLGARVRAACRSHSEGTGDGWLRAFGLWHAALPAAPAPRLSFDLPAQPFVAVLLQREDDDRLRLDADAPPTPAALVAAARDVARRLDAASTVVAVLPRGGLLPREFAPLRRLAGVQIETADAAIDACVAATAVVTVNDPMAVTALLADTPVVHLGRALFGVPGVAQKGRLDSLVADVDRALGEDQPELRKRFLGWMLTHGHVWCSVDLPDHNGLCGLIVQIERRLSRSGALASALQYRAGPAWPLAADRQAGR